MNCWVVIYECKSFPFSASTPFPAVGVSSPPAIAFLFQSLSSSLCLQSLAGVLPTGSKCWSKAGTSVQILYLSDCILRYSEWPVPGWPFPLYCYRCPAAGGLQECFCFREFFSRAAFKFFFPQHNQTSHTVKWQVVKCFIQWNIYIRARFIF